jgi:hypothetical protein
MKMPTILSLLTSGETISHLTIKVLDVHRASRRKPRASARTLSDKIFMLSRIYYVQLEVEVENVMDEIDLSAAVHQDRLVRRHLCDDFQSQTHVDIISRLGDCRRCLSSYSNPS